MTVHAACRVCANIAASHRSVAGLDEVAPGSDAQALVDDHAGAELPNASLEDLMAVGVAVKVFVASNRLAQTHEWTNSTYVPISWPNILPPDWSSDLSLDDAMIAVSAHVRLPDVCINQ